MARMLGSGAVDKAGEAILKRKLKVDEISEGSTKGSTKAAPKAESLGDVEVKQMGNDPKAYQEYQMKKAIEEVRKKKTAQRSAY